MNEKMHPRNPYKDKPPDFALLARKYREFRACCSVAPNGKVKLDFRDPETVRSLARVLLLNDFGLDVELPADRLVPRIPQRLNYILHIEDILRNNSIYENVIGIDIGTGASCIYALLGAKHFGWKFLATDTDVSAAETASRNVLNNHLQEKIEVVRIDEVSLIKDVVRSHSDLNFSFCMCNPPFYKLDEIDQKYTFLSDETVTNETSETSACRSLPHSATTARSNELAVGGGEVAFVSRLIEESLILQDAVKVYTSMLGKKTSLLQLKKKLRRYVHVKTAVLTLCQGKTQRWVLAWTFDPNVKLSMPQRNAPPLELKLPSVLHVKESCDKWLKERLEVLEIAFVNCGDRNSVLCETSKNTWSQQRRKRRAELNNDSGCMPSNTKKFCQGYYSASCQANLGCGDGRDTLSNAGNFNECSITNNNISSEKYDVAIQTFLPAPKELEVILRFRLTLFPCEHLLRFYWLEGSRQSLHQIWQFFKNQLALLECL